MRGSKRLKTTVDTVVIVIIAEALLSGTNLDSATNVDSATNEAGFRN